MKILASIGLIYLASKPFTLALLYNKGIDDTILKNTHSQFFLFALSIVLVLFIPYLWTFKYKQNIKPISNNKYLYYRWLHLLIGFIFILLGISSALICWYTPETFFLSSPSAISGIIFYNIFIALCTFTWLYSSNINSTKRPNLMRFVVSSVIIFGVSDFTLVLSLTLLYAFPGKINSYPAEASYIFVSYLLWGLALVITTKQTVKMR